MRKRVTLRRVMLALLAGLGGISVGFQPTPSPIEAPAK